MKRIERSGLIKIADAIAGLTGVGIVIAYALGWISFESVVVFLLADCAFEIRRLRQFFDR